MMLLLAVLVEEWFVGSNRFLYRDCCHIEPGLGVVGTVSLVVRFDSQSPDRGAHHYPHYPQLRFV